MFDFDIFNGCLILTELDKLGRFGGELGKFGKLASFSSSV